MCWGRKKAQGKNVAPKAALEAKGLEQGDPSKKDKSARGKSGNKSGGKSGGKAGKSAGAKAKSKSKSKPKSKATPVNKSKKPAKPGTIGAGDPGATPMPAKGAAAGGGGAAGGKEKDDRTQEASQMQPSLPPMDERQIKTERTQSAEAAINYPWHKAECEAIDPVKVTVEREDVEKEIEGKNPEYVTLTGFNPDEMWPAFVISDAAGDTKGAGNAKSAMRFSGKRAARDCRTQRSQISGQR
ncbi:unnamed protein product, partial [Mesorhabditis spiculigera]